MFVESLILLLSKLPFHPAFAYLGLAAGLVLEGETVLIAASFAAHRGYLHLPYVMIAGFTITLLTDWFYFFAARTKGRKWVEKNEKVKQKLERIHVLIGRQPYLLFLSFRFLYGLRVLIPLAAGTSRVSSSIFLICSAIGTALWAVVYSLLGYFFGVVLEANIEKLERYEIPIIFGILLTGALIMRLRKYLNRRSENHSSKSN